MKLAFIHFIAYKKTLVSLITVDGKTRNASEMQLRARGFDENQINNNNPFSGAIGKYPPLYFFFIRL